MHNLDQAITILGFKTVRAIALTIGVINAFQEEQAGYNLRRHWVHGAVNACVSRSIAKQVDLPDPELAFVVGILHRIGMLVMMQYAPEETRAAITLARDHKLSLDGAVNKLFETNYAEVGAWLCQQWDLDVNIINAIRYQHDLQAAPDSELVSVSQFTEYLPPQTHSSPGEHGEPNLDDQGVAAPWLR